MSVWMKTIYFGIIFLSDVCLKILLLVLLFFTDILNYFMLLSLLLIDVWNGPPSTQQLSCLGWILYLWIELMCIFVSTRWQLYLVWWGKKVTIIATNEYNKHFLQVELDDISSQLLDPCYQVSLIYIHIAYIRHFLHFDYQVLTSEAFQAEAQTFRFPCFLSFSIANVFCFYLLTKTITINISLESLNYTNFNFGCVLHLTM